MQCQAFFMGKLCDRRPGHVVTCIRVHGLRKLFRPSAFSPAGVNENLVIHLSPSLLLCDRHAAPYFSMTEFTVSKLMLDDLPPPAPVLVVRSISTQTGPGPHAVMTPPKPPSVAFTRKEVLRNSRKYHAKWGLARAPPKTRCSSFVRGRNYTACNHLAIYTRADGQHACGWHRYPLTQKKRVRRASVPAAKRQRTEPPIVVIEDCPPESSIPLVPSTHSSEFDLRSVPDVQWCDSVLR